MNITAQLLPTHDGRMAAVRAPSAAMINFAQRVDLLTEIETERGSIIEAVKQQNWASLDEYDETWATSGLIELPDDGSYTVKTPTGRVCAVYNRSNGVFEGEQRVYAGNDLPLRRFYCRNGERVGYELFLNRDGSIRRALIWQDGEATAVSDSELAGLDPDMNLER